MTQATFGRRGAALPPTRRLAPAAQPAWATAQPVRSAAQPAWSPTPTAAAKPALPSREDSLAGWFLWLFFSFDGRLDRRTYRWVRIAVNLGYLFAAWAIDDQIFRSFDNTLALLCWSLVGFCLVVVMIWSTLAMQVKRRHDRDKSWGWLFLGFIPIVGPFWVLIECCWFEGTPGYNRFDDASKTAADAFV